MSEREHWARYFDCCAKIEDLYAESRLELLAIQTEDGDPPSLGIMEEAQECRRMAEELRDHAAEYRKEIKKGEP